MKRWKDSQGPLYLRSRVEPITLENYHWTRKGQESKVHHSCVTFRGMNICDLSWLSCSQPHSFKQLWSKIYPVWKLKIRTTDDLGKGLLFSCFLLSCQGRVFSLQIFSLRYLPRNCQVGLKVVWMQDKSLIRLDLLAGLSGSNSSLVWSYTLLFH